MLQHTCRSKWDRIVLVISAVLLFPWNASAQTNLALGKPAAQSSTLTGWGSAVGASKAVDGNTDGNFSDGSVAHTNFDANA